MCVFTLLKHLRLGWTQIMQILKFLWYGRSVSAFLGFSALFETPSHSFAQVGGRHKKRIRGEAEKHVTGDELDAWVKQGASIVLSHDLI